MKVTIKLQSNIEQAPEAASCADCQQHPSISKECLHCHVTKPIDHFYGKGLTKTGRRKFDSICKTCKLENASIKYKKNTTLKLVTNSQPTHVKCKKLQVTEQMITEVASNPAKDYLISGLTDCLRDLAFETFINLKAPRGDPDE